LFFDNVLFEDEKIKAILDFEDVCRIYKVFDLGMAAVGICTEGTKTELNQVRALVNGYQEVRLLEKIEKDSLQIFIECAAILTSTWRFWKYNLDEPDIEKSNKYLQMVKIAENVSLIPKMLFMSTVFVK
jgi:homoserine kinase type II